MSAVVQEWLNVVVRWAHVIAAIMWIGDSFLFMWLDSHLTTPTKKRDGDVVGELWMTHSGGFYEMVKRKTLAKDELPPLIHWFKWESYSTWITGFLLLVIVYYAGGRAMLVEASSTLSHEEAVAISLGCLAAGVVFYDFLCRTPVIKNNRIFGVIALGLIVTVAWGLLQVFSPRAVFLQIGAMLGTIMASNVFFRIIPSQRHMLSATAAGEPVDPAYGYRAKQRSVHNHYLTLPVLFTMLSNHFPGLYAHAQSWAVVGLVFVAGVGVKYFMNFRLKTHPVIIVGTVVAFSAVGILTLPTKADGSTTSPAGDQVAWSTVQKILEARCLGCHAKKPTTPGFAAPPVGMTFEDPRDVVAQKDRILIRAVQTKTMPLGNLTGMTEEERAILGRWIAQGAKTGAR
ncbi:MAG: urate hydroxylase PuuD [Deltaproteobacteria bacterium]|nr:urate hydroxylase PuuD [Deltaproteobacteria bacterium]